MDDLFEREQTILDHALSHLQEIENGAPCTIDDYAAMVKEYKKLLKQLRRVTKISDRTTIDLNASRLDLQDKVHFDELTGIYNRRFLDENLNLILPSLANNGGTLSVLMIDVDFFKRYNDTYGHGKGDDCLRAIAQTINNSTTRIHDFVARYGGEEFVAVLQNTSQDIACMIAQRIIKSVLNTAIPHEKNDVSKYVTVSVGVTTGRVMPFHTMEDFVKIADKALYISKRSGRNRSTFINMP